MRAACPCNSGTGQLHETSRTASITKTRGKERDVEEGQKDKAKGHTGLQKAEQFLQTSQQNTEHAYLSI
jgi:hypothetical protein